MPSVMQWSADVHNMFTGSHLQCTTWKCFIAIFWAKNEGYYSKENDLITAISTILPIINTCTSLLCSCALYCFDMLLIWSSEASSLTWSSSLLCLTFSYYKPGKNNNSDYCCNTKEMYISKSGVIWLLFKMLSEFKHLLQERRSASLAYHFLIILLSFCLQTGYYFRNIGL